jgi:CHAD domain-containing protein
MKTIYVCLSNAIEQNGANLIQHLRTARSKISIESVHEVRVSCRKLEACLKIMDQLGIQRKKLRRDINNIRKIYGPLRNLHVVLESIKRIKENEKLVKLKLFKKFLKRDEKSVLNKIFNQPKKISLKNLHRELQKVTQMLRMLKDSQIANEKAYIKMKTGNKKAVKKFKKIKHALSLISQKSIHNLRIAAKKLRYRYEILKPVMSFEGVNVEELKHIQEIFGQIQNNFVLQKSIRKYLHKYSSKEGSAVLRLQTTVIKEHQTLIAVVR